MSEENKPEPDPKLARKIARWYWRLQPGENYNLLWIAQNFKADPHIVGLTVTSYMLDHGLIPRRAIQGSDGSLQGTTLIRVRGVRRRRR